MQSSREIKSFTDINSFLPDDWKLVKNRAIFKERNERNGEEDLELLSVTQNQGIIRQSEYDVKKDTSNDDKSKYKKVYPGDIVYNKMRMWQGAVGLSDYKGIVSPAYVVLKPFGNVEPKYLYYLMKTPAYIAQSYSYSYGLCDDMNSLRYEDFRNMLSILPPCSVQNKIVSCLDGKFTKIDLFIDNKIKYIEKLKEQKHAVINQAITKGINKDTAFKPSGFDWLGEIPKHWKLEKIRHIFEFVNRGTTASYIETSNLRVVNQANFSKGFFDWDNLQFQSESQSGNRRALIVNDDILLASTGGGVLGKVFLFSSKAGTELVADSHVTIIRTQKQTILPKYFYYFFSVNYNLINGILAQGSTNQTELQKNWLRDLFVPLPDKKEQGQIVKYIENESSLIDQAVSKAEQQIELIKEYKTSLITDAVTGQLNIKE